MNYDVIIVGGGLVGLTSAIALAQQTTLSIAILEAQPFTAAWQAAQYHHRVSAVSLASVHIFQALQIWESMKAKRVSPFTQIQVWDANDKTMQFDGAAIKEAILGYIIENNVMQTVLLEKIKQYPQIHYFSPVTLQAVQQTAEQVAITLADHRVITAELAVAADGAQSWLREQMGITVQQYDYQQTAIVATVATEKSHQQIASQVFLPTGPLAFLPLKEAQQSSIVWSLPVAEAQAYLALDEAAFNAKLTEAFAKRLGDVTLQSPRFSFPLYQQQAKNYIASRVALVGDAAHVIHPLAGQGVNLGLLDAASLVEVIVEAIKNRRQFASVATLRSYERWRKADNLVMMTGVEVIKTLFGSEKQSVQALRTLGLEVTNKVEWIKNKFMQHAVGVRNGLPRLASK